MQEEEDIDCSENEYTYLPDDLVLNQFDRNVKDEYEYDYESKEENNNLYHNDIETYPEDNCNWKERSNYHNNQYQEPERLLQNFEPDGSFSQWILLRKQYHHKRPKHNYYN